jgi:hypothetical protein
MAKKICKGCKKEFEPHHGKQLYCSSYCYPEKSQNSPLEKIICKQCGKEFLGHTNQKLCGITCFIIYDRGQRQTERQKRKDERKAHSPKEPCLWCHKLFSKMYEVNFYCCSECGSEFRRARNQIYKKFSFDSEKRNLEIDKLRKEGKNYGSK